MKDYIFSTITEADKKLPYYVLGAGRNWNQEHVVCPNGYFFQWIQSVHGEGELITGGKTYRIKEGCGMLLVKDIAHEYYSVSPNWIVDWIVFDGDQVMSFLLQNANINSSRLLYTNRPDLFSSRIREVMEIIKSGNALSSIRCSGILYSLLTDIMQYTSDQPNNSSLSQHLRLKPVFDYIDQNYDKTLALEDLAAISEVTPQHLCTIFKKTTSIRIFQYINSVRIKKSKELLLQNPQMSIKEVSNASGFDDFNYFCSVFKKHENITPGQFRKLHYFLFVPT